MAPDPADADAPLVQPPSLEPMAEDDAPWYRPLLVGVGALLAVALLVGAVVGVAALGVVNVAGLGEERATVQAEPSLHIPERTPTPTTDDEGLTLEDLNGGEDPTESESATPSATPTASESPKERKRKPPRSVISLSSSAVEVSAMERIDLTGTYPGGEGATLRVQRFSGGWQDFAGVTATVRDGTFSTYVMTGQSGPNRFRVVDGGSGKKSNPVTVRVR